MSAKEANDEEELNFAILEALEAEDVATAESEDQQAPLQKRLTSKEHRVQKLHLRQRLPQAALAHLSEDLTLQVLCHVSAVDLTALAQTCKVLSKISKDTALWRPLFLARWGEKPEQSGRLPDIASWKEKYLDHDAQDIADVMIKVPGVMQQFYLQMVTARRTIIVPRTRAFLVPVDIALRAKILSWRGMKGKSDCPNPDLGLKHTHCSKRGPYTALEGGLYMCESCGWAHLCGDACTERLVDEPSELLVCPVSGRCYERLVADWERVIQDDSRDVLEAEGGNDFGAAGIWGRAYVEGYNCASEEELRYKCGAVV